MGDVVAQIRTANVMLNAIRRENYAVPGVGHAQKQERRHSPVAARLRDASSHDVADYLATRHPFRPPPFRVSRFVLYSSRESIGGGPYVVEAAYPLAA